MSTAPIGQTQIQALHTRSVAEQQELLRAYHRPVDLFAEHQFERVDAQSLTDAGRALPIRGEEEHNRIQELLAGVPPESQAIINGAIDDLMLALYTEAPKHNPQAGPVGGESVSTALTEQVEESYEVFMTHSGHAQRDAATLEFQVMTMANFERDITDFAEQVDAKNEQSRIARVE